MTMTDYETMLQWVSQYDEVDMEWHSSGEMAALLAMHNIIDNWEPLDVKQAQKQVRRCIEVLQAFEGRMAQLEAFNELRSDSKNKCQSRR